MATMQVLFKTVLVSYIDGLKSLVFSYKLRMQAQAIHTFLKKLIAALSWH